MQKALNINVSDLSALADSEVTMSGAELSSGLSEELDAEQEDLEENERANENVVDYNKVVPKPVKGKKVEKEDVTLVSKFVNLVDILPPLPKKGDFDVQTIRNSQYFFS